MTETGWSRAAEIGVRLEDESEHSEGSLRDRHGRCDKCAALIVREKPDSVVVEEAIELLR
jgi:hypothetical protein